MAKRDAPSSFPALISKLELFVYEYQVACSGSGSVTAIRRAGGKWGDLAVKKYYWLPQAEIAEPVSLAAFPSASYVTYIARITDVLGRTRSESWSFAAGDWPCPSAPVPLWRNGPHNCRIDIAFVATQPYYVTPREMLKGLKTLIFDGYHQSNGIAPGRGYWQFYYASDRLTSFTVSGQKINGVQNAPPPGNRFHAVAAIHNDPPLKDYWDGNKLFTAPISNRGTAVHETAHVIFGLADEYDNATFPAFVPKSGIAGTQQPPPDHPNTFQDRPSCEAYNVNHSLPVSECQPIGNTGWYRSEAAARQCIMYNDGDANLPSFGPTCTKRTEWFYKEFFPAKGCSASVLDPSAVPESVTIFPN
jgi:hypothetical protein